MSSRGYLRKLLRLTELHAAYKACPSADNGAALEGFVESLQDAADDGCPDSREALQSVGLYEPVES